MAQDEFSTGTVELEEAELKVDKPPLFTVVICLGIGWAISKGIMFGLTHI